MLEPCGSLAKIGNPRLRMTRNTPQALRKTMRRRNYIGESDTWSCNLFDVLYLGIKVVTDIVDGDKPSQEEFLENLGTAALYVCGQ